MSTQLRLISTEAPDADTVAPDVVASTPVLAAETTDVPEAPEVHPPKTGATSRGRTRSTRSAARRRPSGHGRWSLDERTRAVGRAGVASARAALAKAHAQDGLRQAS